MATFSDMVKQHGSVSAALKAQGYSKGSDGSWRKNSTSSSGGSSGSSGGASGSSGGSKGSASGYFNPDLDYSLEIKNAKEAGASQEYISRLQQERQNKIDAKYGGSDPYKGISDIMGGYSPSGGSSGGLYGTVSQDINYQDLINQAVAKGDYTSAAIYEQMRNQKISSPDYKGKQTATNYYSQYLPENQQMMELPEIEIPSFEEFLAQTGYDQYREATQQRIQAAVQQAVNSYNSQIEQTNKDSDELARQAYIAKMLGQKNLDQQLSAAGYAGGMADSQRIQTETNYEKNLQSIEEQRQLVIAELQQAIRDAQLSGDREAAQELQAYLQAMQSSWLSYVQNQQAIQSSNYWNQQQLQSNQQQMRTQQAATAYDRAMELLGMGIMPGTDVLTQAGISTQEAQAIRSTVLGQGTAGSAAASGGTAAARSSGASGRSGYDNGSLTAAQVRQMQQALGVTADGMWGSESRTAAQGMSADEAWAAMNPTGTVQSGGGSGFSAMAYSSYLSRGDLEGADTYLAKYWNTMTPAQQATVNDLIRAYGLA